VQLVFLFTDFLYSQEIQKPINIQSPDASTLIGVSEIPVSYFTGIALVSIPLYTIKESGLDLSLALRYNASGVRINQHPGIVGQNWTLEAGGVITRSVQGYPDEEIIDYALLGTDHVGFMYRCVDLASYNGSYEELETYAYNHTTYGYDYEPDIFSFNFFNYSGTFFIDNDGNWKVRCDENLRIIPNSELIFPLYEELAPSPVICNQSTNIKALSGFTIIDDYGTKYIFGTDINAIEFSIDFFRQALCQSWVANAWYLSQVIDKNGRELYSFEYERKDFIANFYLGINYKKSLLSD